jgi:DNA-nicking Smr family endonuclease
MARSRPRRNSGGAPSPAGAADGLDADGPKGSSGEAELFRAAVRDVTPLPKTERAEPALGGELRKRRRAAARRTVDGEPGAELEDAALGDVALGDAALDGDSPTGADTLSFHRPGVRARTLKQLRRGLYPVEDELDLHGLSQAAARDSLVEFLAYGAAAGYRCVRIVHGKGYRSGARGPILKIAVNTWLKRHPDVMAFTSARPIDGGTGAVYVLLRA